MTANVIIRELKTEFDEPIAQELMEINLGLPPEQRTREWTRIVVRGICRVGRRDPWGFKARASSGVQDADRDGPEWLHDVTWLEHNHENQLISIPLVAECEWGNWKKIKEDFEKLLVARASVRVMVYDPTGHPGNIPENHTEELKQVIEAFCGTARDKYLLVYCCNNGEEEWWFEYTVL